MGKKRIATKGEKDAKDDAPKVSAKLSRKKIESGTLHVQSTYNNTKLLLTDKKGNALFWSTSGALGFKGAKKGTPFAAAKIAETIGDQAKTLGIREVDVVVKGVGSGRESSIRAFMAKGIAINSIKDATANPWNGPRPPKPRRV